MKLFRICIVPIILALIGSCFTVPRYSVKVNSFSRDYDISHKVIIVPLDKNLSANDLQFIEFSKHVTKALEKNGFQVVTDFNDANVIVTLYYSISAPISQTLSIPQFGPTGIESSTTHGTIHSYGNWGTYSGSTTYQQRYGITGYRQVEHTVYIRLIDLSAYDKAALHEKNEVVQLWKTQIVSTGSSSDLRSVFPIMIAAALEYIGKNTNKEIEITLTQYDDRVKQILE